MSGGTIDIGGLLDNVQAAGAVDGDRLAQVLDRVEALVHDDPAMADALAQRCAQTAATAGLHPACARANYLRARVHAERGELDQALELIAAARTGWLAAGRPVSALRTELGRMQVLDDLGRHGEAAALGESVLRDLDRLDHDDLRSEDAALLGWVRATTLNNLGVAYSFVGEHERTIEAYARAETAYARLDLPEEIAKPRANRGIELLQLGRAREARDALQSASATFARAGDRLWTAKCAGNIGQAQLQLGELVDALRVLEPARATLDELGVDPEAARVQLAIADVYLTAGLYREARADAADAANRMLRSGMRHDAAVAVFTMAQGDLGVGALDRADTELQRAAELFEEVGDPQYRARAQLARVDVAVGRGATGAAVEMAAGAAAALAAGGWPIPLAWARLRQADLAEDAAAHGYLADAVELIDRLQLPQLRFALLFRLARLHRRQGLTEHVEALLREAIDIAEQMGSALPDPVLRAAFRTDKLTAYDDLVEVLIGRGCPGDVAAACRVADRAKAQTLLDVISGTVGAARRGDVARDREVARLRCDLSATYAALVQATDASRRALVQRRAEDLELQLSTLRIRHTIADEPSRSTRSGSAVERQPADPTLAYHVMGDDVIAFLQRGDVVTAHRIAGVFGAVKRELHLLAVQWSRFGIGAGFARRNMGRLLATTQHTLRELYQLLVAPLREQLEEISEDELVIVPHRRLYRVPFHALHDGRGYLGERWAITLAPTITRIRQWSGGAARRDDGMLVLAVPDTHAPAIDAEARALAGFDGARLVLGEDATSASIRESLPGPAILHIACHGLYRKDNPLFSALRLSDRWVTSAEVLELDLDGALVTLSACESGRNPTDTAEPVGLAWAFLAAGASGVVTSNWIVDDETTAHLMSTMYGHIASGASPAEALRRAQLSTIAEHPHPYYWAPFSYVASPAVPLGGNHVRD